jgi:L-2-hydroxyglutarate oxidase LhgO
MAERLDCAVIGAGVIGLAVARALALAGREVVVLEAAATIGSVTSSRNSEVIHAGLYYPKDSWKAKLCLRGKHLLYDYCESHGVPYRRCGKLVVAGGGGEIERLVGIEARARGNGVDDLVWLDRDQIRALEPEVAGAAALLSPSSGTLDSHALMLALQGDAEARGAMVAFNAPVLGGRVSEGGIDLEVGGDAPMALACRSVVNAAGLAAPALARRLAGLDPASVPKAYLAKGNYFTLAGRVPFRHLVYPVPEPGGLGVHLTVDLAGRARFGPDVEWVETVDYRVDPARAARFYEAIRRYWPGLPDGALLPDYAGIRPKIVGPGAPAADFQIQGPEVHGVSGLVNLFGIESPGLTACLALAEVVAERLG